MPTAKTIRTFLWSQFSVTPAESTHDFVGQTVIVTGSNTGLGLEAARQFAKLGCARLILAVRTPSKGEHAKESILQSTSRSDDCIEVWPLDMCSTESVKAFVTRAAALDRLDVLVANAGVTSNKWSEHEGMEQIIKVNVVSTMLIVLSLLRKLRATAKSCSSTPHLVVVTSDTAKWVKYEEGEEDDIFAHLADRRYFEAQPNSRYYTSKLMGLLFIRELAKKTAVPVMTLVTPGLTRTQLMTRSASKVESWVVKVFTGIFGRRVEIGARTLVTGACAGAENHGQYMEDGENVEPDLSIPPHVQERLQKKTYDQTLAYLEKLVPGISNNI